MCVGGRGDCVCHVIQMAAESAVTVTLSEQDPVLSEGHHAHQSAVIYPRSRNRVEF